MLMQPSVRLWRSLFCLLLGYMADTTPAQASPLKWNWSYSATGIAASGTFTTVDTPDASGFYLITAISGTRNGEAITGLQTTGTAIPGNEPFAVDNLVRLFGPQLTHNGFGFATSGGNFANPFFADFLSPPRYLEFFSAPPFTGGTGPGDSELAIGFTASVVPEPETWALMLAGIGLLRLPSRWHPAGSQREKPNPG